MATVSHGSRQGLWLFSRRLGFGVLRNGHAGVPADRHRKAPSRHEHAALSNGTRPGTLRRHTTSGHLQPYALTLRAFVPVLRSTSAVFHIDRVAMRLGSLAEPRYPCSAMAFRAAGKGVQKCKTCPCAPKDLVSFLSSGGIMDASVIPGKQSESVCLTFTRAGRRRWGRGYKGVEPDE